jgi:hypothetical protein
VTDDPLITLPSSQKEPLENEPVQKELDLAAQPPCSKKKKKSRFKGCLKGGIFGFVTFLFWSLLWIFCAILALFFILWLKLLHSPLSLDRFSTPLMKALSTPYQQITLIRPELRLNSHDITGIFSLHAEEMDVVSIDTYKDPAHGLQQSRYFVKNVDIQLSGQSLLEGKLRPRRIDVEAIDFGIGLEKKSTSPLPIASVSVLDPSGGKSQEKQPEQSSSESSSSPSEGSDHFTLSSMREVFDRLFIHNAWGESLQEIFIKNIAIKTIIQPHRPVTLNRGQLEVQRHSSEMVMRLRGYVDLNHATLPLLLEGDYNREKDEFHARLIIEPTVIDSEGIPELKKLSPVPIKAKMSFQAEVTLNGKDKIKKAYLSTQMQELSLPFPSLLTSAQHAEVFHTKKAITLPPFQGKIQKLELTAFYDQTENKASFETLFQSPDFGEVKLLAEAQALNPFLWQDEGESFPLKTTLEAKNLNYNGLFNKPITLRPSVMRGFFSLKDQSLDSVEAAFYPENITLNAQGDVAWGEGQLSPHDASNVVLNTLLTLNTPPQKIKEKSPLKTQSLKDQPVKQIIPNVPPPSSTKTPVKNGLKMALDFQISDLTREGLLEIWPVKIPGSAREWVSQNLEQGTFSTAQGEVLLNPDFSLDITVPFNNVTAHYNRPMTPLRAGKGVLQLSQNELDIVFDEARVGGVELMHSKFYIPDLSVDIPLADISLSLKGKVPDLLSILDEKPLQFMHKSGVDPRTSGGVFDGKLSLKFPLIQDLKTQDLLINADVDVKDFKLSVGKGKDVYALSRTDLNLKATGHTIDAIGKGLINGVEAHLGWKEDLDVPPDSKKIPTLLKATFDSLSIDDLLKFGIDVRLFASGLSKTMVDIGLKKGSVVKLTAESDLTGTVLKLPASNWTLGTGVPKQLTFSGAENKEGRLQLDALALKAGENKLLAHHITFNDQGIATAFVDHAHLNGLASLSGEYSRKSTGEHVFKGKGDLLDLSSLFSEAQGPHPQEKEQEKDEPNNPLKNAPAEPFLPLDVDMTLDRFILMKDMETKPLRLTAKTEGQTPYTISGVLQPLHKKEWHSTYSWSRTPNNMRLFELESDNVGGLLEMFDLYHYLHKGKVHLKGEQFPDGSMKGTLRIQDGLVIGAPVLAHLLSLVSLDGIVGALEDEGLILDRIESGFKKTGKAFEFWDGLIRTPALGISFRGGINQSSKQMNLEGTIVPFYMINSLFNEVPLLGEIIGHREQEGLLGITYTMKGPLDKPDTSVNPLSILAPGFLRSIFE